MNTFIKKNYIMLAIIFLIANFAWGQGATVETVSPSSAESNATVTVTITLSGDIPPHITSATIGSTAGTIQSYDDTEGKIKASFDFQGETTGLKDVSVTFSTPDDSITITKAGAFTIGSTGSLTIAINPGGAVSAGAKWNVDSGSWNESGVTVSDLVEGNHTVSFSSVIDWDKPGDMTVSISGNVSESATYTEISVTLTYPVVDTGQDFCSSNSAEITCPSSGEAFYGQDAQYSGYQFSYQLATISGDKVVNDLVTGLMWQQTIDTDGDGDIDAGDKKSLSDSKTYCENLTLAGYTDWRLPNIKELYSLIDFRGGDCSGYEGSDTSVLTPLIDNTVFDYDWGDTAADERLIDSQYASDTEYADTTVNEGGTLFGVNFADGRIKGYELVLHGTDKTFFCQCVRSNTSYGVNNFTDNGDNTITDNATGLMWSKNDSGSGLNWEDALAWVSTKNASDYLGYSDWRMPNAKELQSILDYTRSPATSSSAAIDLLFNATKITNEADQDDYPYYWTSTTHLKYNGSVGSGVYISFGRAIGDYGDGDGWQDVHGAGAQRSDPKSPEDGVTYPNSNGPQGDAQRVYNYVRLVRDADTVTETGTLTVTIGPSVAVTAGAQWSIDSGTTWKDSGTSETLDVGTAYTVTFKTVSGYDKPSDMSGTIVSGSNSVTGTYTEQTVETGTLTVSIEPQGAIDVGAQWSINGGSTWKNSGTSETLDVGTAYTVTFKTVSGYDKPSDMPGTIASGSNSVTGTYTQQTGTLTVNIEPTGAVTAGAQWSIDGGNTWKNSGTSETLNVGTAYTVTFRTVSGYDSPADITGTIASGSNSVTGTYTEQTVETGTLTVNIEPQGAVTVGAQWSINGGSTWKNSGTSETLDVGTAYTVTFKTISGYDSPADVTGTIASGSNSVTGTYTQQTGTLTVSIKPQGAVSAGAQWSIDGGNTWKNSGTSETLDVGTAYTVTFKTVTAYDSPADVTGTIVSGSNSATGIYTEQTPACDYSLEDVIILLKINAGFNDSVTWEDPDSDGKATLKDALYIIQCLSGLGTRKKRIIPAVIPGKIGRS